MARRAIQPFDLEHWRGEKDSRIQWGDLGSLIDRLIDPASARETLHWGRNYLYTTEVELPNERLDVVVKQFRNEASRSTRSPRTRTIWRRRRRNPTD
ncbi:MAG: hypothetical protein AAF449_18915, partial [Myxococcota bacterium]